MKGTPMAAAEPTDRLSGQADSTAAHEGNGAGGAPHLRKVSAMDTNGAAVAPATAIPPGSRVLKLAGRYVARHALDVSTDIVALLISASVGLLLLSMLSHDPNNSMSHFWISLLHLGLLFPAFLIAFITYGLYRRSARRIQPSVFDDLSDIAHAIAAGGFIAVAIVVAIHKFTGVQVSVTSQLVAMGAAGLILIPAARAIVASVIPWRVGSTRRTVIVGTGTVAQQMARRLRATRGVSLIGFVDDDPLPGFDVLGTFAQLPDLCHRQRVDQVIVAFSHAHPSDLTAILRGLQGRVSLAVVPRFFELASWHSQMEEIYGLPIMDIASPHLGGAPQMGKRAVDVALASIGLVLLAPLLAAIAITIKLSSRGPVLFRQTRLGQNRRPFMIFKFRTMRIGAEGEREELRNRNQADGPLFKMKQDPRVTMIGRALRRTSMDELPQLWNVVLGHMSLVGPRPLVPDESMRIDGWAARRFEVRPGLTGQWQISGRNELAHDELCRLDYLYVACWSMQWDFRILWQTVARVGSGYGAY
jgi:exopolysaccharide biosynthesis polyprenyl glycosylphosphotransferase